MFTHGHFSLLELLRCNVVHHKPLQRADNGITSVHNLQCRRGVVESILLALVGALQKDNFVEEMSLFADCTTPSVNHMIRRFEIWLTVGSWRFQLVRVSQMEKLQCFN